MYCKANFKATAWGRLFVTLMGLLDDGKNACVYQKLSTALPHCPPFLHLGSLNTHLADRCMRQGVQGVFHLEPCADRKMSITGDSSVPFHQPSCQAMRRRRPCGLVTVDPVTSLRQRNSVFEKRESW